MTQDPKRWKDDENAPEALRAFLLDAHAEAPVLPEALRAKVVQSVARRPVRVMPIVVGGALALAAAALLAIAMNTSTVQPALPVPTLEPEPRDAGPDAPSLDALQVELACDEEHDWGRDCHLQVHTTRMYTRVVMHSARGIPSCESAFEGGSPMGDAPDFYWQITDYEGEESFRVCAYDGETLRATGVVEGERRSPFVTVYARDDRYDVHVALTELDVDARAVRLVRIPRDEAADVEAREEDDARIARVGCDGTTEAVWTAEAYRRLVRESALNEFALVHYAARGSERETPIFIACIETERGAEHAPRNLWSDWAEAEPMVLTPSGEVRWNNVRTLHQVMTLAVPTVDDPEPQWRTTTAFVGERFRHDSIDVREITSASGARVRIPSGASLPGDEILWSDGRREGIAAAGPDGERAMRRWSTPHPVFVNGVRVQLPWPGRDKEREAWTPDAPELVRAVPYYAWDCRLASVLEVESIPEGTRSIGIAARRFRGAPGSRLAMTCEESELLVEFAASDLEAVPHSSDGVLRIATNLSVTQARAADGSAIIVERTRDSDDGPATCEAGYEVIACIRDASGLHALSGARGRWAETGPACFTADTPIASPRGDVPIASLQPGMRVFAFDAQTQTRTVTRVTRLIPRGAQPILALTLSNGQTMRVTAEHPLLDAQTNAFRTAGSFHTGDVMRGVAGEVVHVVRVIDTHEHAEVFDLSVEGPHTYFANGVVAHNY